MKQSKYIKEKHKLKRLLENKLNKDYYGNCMLDRLVRLELSLFQCKDCKYNYIGKCMIVGLMVLK